MCFKEVEIGFKKHWPQLVERNQPPDSEDGTKTKNG